MPNTELPGDVARWGADHLQPSAGACCAACAALGDKCNEWVWCADADACGERHRQCWLKHRPRPLDDVDMLRGRSALWTSGILTLPPAPPSAAALAAARASSLHHDFGLLTADGLVRVRLRREAPNAAAYARAVLAALLAARPATSRTDPTLQPNKVRPRRSGLRFYRAEPVPARWGDPRWPDTWDGGRWGPPYALLQGSLRPDTGAVPPAKPDNGPGAHPVIRRGMIAWAGGGGGPDFFIALAAHPEWGNGHTVWADVLEPDMAVVDAIMARPLRVANWGTINATELVTPVPFTLTAAAAKDDAPTSEE